MGQFINLETDQRNVAVMTINRPRLHNALNAELLEEIRAGLELVAADSSLRAMILTGEGASFSAGADLNWMREMAQAGEQKNREDALALAAVLRRLAFLPLPTIARVNGAAFGGGVGLIACCDIAIAASSARFGLTEARLGLVPAVISPYVVHAIGARHAGHLFMTAQRFGADQALNYRLLHRVVPDQELDAAVDEEIEHLLSCGPNAVRAAKSLVQAVSARTEPAQAELDKATANLIASLRMSPEGQEGMSAFLEKRRPDWPS